MCEHYLRECDILAPCCNKYYSCRLCHDDDEENEFDHKVDRTKVIKIRCRKCQKEQTPDQKCVNDDCQTEFGSYFCSICNLWESNPDRDIFHCHQCGICRVGKVEELFHCEKCVMCLNIQLKDNHKCLEKSFQTACPICSEEMFDSTSNASLLPCGHTMHAECYKEYVKHSYKCPLCKKTVADLSIYWQNLKDQVDTLIIPNIPYEASNWKTEIYCNDCGEKTTVKYCFQYHQCTNSECGSFNTDILNIIKDDPIPNPDDEEDAGGVAPLFDDI
jgi:hypothetical protein